jgi:GNAT superfamily N-acetyltransferase
MPEFSSLPPLTCLATPHSAHLLAEQLTIGPARMRDWHSISVLVARNFPLVREASLGHWLCHQLPYFQVARLGGHQVVGILHAQPRQDTGTLWINLLAVEEHLRHHGIAHHLVAHAESVCRDWQCQRIGLQCATTNVAALHLYACHGYGLLSESTTELGVRVVGHVKILPVTDAPHSCPRPTVRLDARPLRRLYRLCYVLGYRHRSPVPR